MSLNPQVLAKGVDEDAVNRLIFRLNFIEKCADEHIKALKEGVADLTPMVGAGMGFTQDFIDVVRELLTLFQQEQGLATPPNGEASSAESPGGS